MDAAAGQLKTDRSHPPLWVPLGVLVLGTWAIRGLGLDLAVARWLHGFGRFFDTDSGWLGVLYHWAPWPSLLLAAGALGGLAVAPWMSAARRYRRAALFLVLLMALGPGLLVNVILKDYTGRPRPYQSEPFGGPFPYREAWELGPPGEGYSFPSGHASTAFYWMGLFFVCWRSRRRCAWIALGVGLAWGLVIGVVRMVQGGHFLSDVLWAGGLIYLLGWGLWYWLRPDWPAARDGSVDS